MPIIAEQVLDKRLHSIGSTVQCSHLVGPKVLLLGDAAHGVTARLGQGCNSALESVGVFDQARFLIFSDCSLMLSSAPESIVILALNAKLC